LGWLAIVVVGASALLVVLVGPLHIATGGTGHVAAVLAFVGVLAGTRQSRKFRSSYVADAGGSVSEAMHAVSRRRI